LHRRESIGVPVTAMTSAQTLSMSPPPRSRASTAPAEVLTLEGLADAGAAAVDAGAEQ
jgi:hypothetical protein